MQAAEVAPSQTTLHQSYRFHIASPHAYNVASDFSPGHHALPRIFTNPKKSQLAEITQLLFQSGSKDLLAKTIFVHRAHGLHDTGMRFGHTR
jgi:hypothetical protein